MWDFSAGHEITVSNLFGQITTQGEAIEGITLLGGEPLDQYKETLTLLHLCAEAGLGTMLFTGYELQEMDQNGMAAVRQNLDILVTGRYKEDYRTLQHQWIGSTNQEIHFLTSRYSSKDIKNGNYIEITVDEDGSLTILGFPPATIN